MSEETLSLKDQINFLFDNILHPEGRPYLIQEVVEHVNISHATIHQIRSGNNKKPSILTLREIAHFFDVPLDFFNCETYQECYAVLARKRLEELPDPIAKLVLRATGLSPQAQKEALSAISWIAAADEARKAGREMPPLPEDTEKT